MAKYHPTAAFTAGTAAADGNRARQDLAELGLQAGGAGGVTGTWREGRIRKSSGEPLIVELSTRELPEEQGGGTLLTFRDLTERKRAERVARAHAAALVNTLRGLARSATLDTYLGEVLKSLAGQLGETSGGLWLYEEDAGLLRLYLDCFDGELQTGPESGP